MKYSVSIYSFHQYTKKGLITTKECIDKASEMGFDGIEFTDSVFADADDKKAYASELKAYAGSRGIVISNLAVGAELLADDLDAEVDKLKGWIDIASLLGCPTMRHDVTRGIDNRTWQGYDTVTERLADGCRRVTEYAKSRGVVTMTENHGFFSQDSQRVEKLVNTVADENFGQLVDIGNFLCADDDPATAVGRCAPYAKYVHIKDFIVKNGNGINPGRGFFMTRGGNYLRGTVIGHGDVPVIRCLRALKRAGYDGWAAIEFEGMEDCLDGISIGFENLKGYASLI